jgi:exodeoxyribonuclease VII small subunit
MPSDFGGVVLTMAGKKTLDLEKSLSGLEALVEELEGGELPLDKALQKFEEGVRLTRECQAALKDAEQKVKILLADSDGEETLQDFAADE